MAYNPSFAPDPLPVGGFEFDRSVFAYALRGPPQASPPASADENSDDDLDTDEDDAPDMLDALPLQLEQSKCAPGCTLSAFSILDLRDGSADRAALGETQDWLAAGAFPSAAEDRAVGAMLGMAVGDALGAPVEFQPVQYARLDVVTGMGAPGSVQGGFGLRPGQYTDDTSMGLCLADSLLSRNGVLDNYDLMLRFVSWWFFGYNNAFAEDPDGARPSVGLGGLIKQSFIRFLRRGVRRGAGVV